MRRLPPSTLFVAEQDSDEFNEIKTNLKDFGAQDLRAVHNRRARHRKRLGRLNLDELNNFKVDRYVEIYSAAYKASQSAE